MEGAIGLAQTLNLKRRLERLDLGPKAVAFNSDRDASKELLPALLRVLNPAREEDRAGAGAPDRLLADKGTERLEEASEASQKGDCS